MKIFEGKRIAEIRELHLRAKIAERSKLGKQIEVAAVVFTEDAGSQLYTQHKVDAAQRVGITYTPHFVSVTDSLSSLLGLLQDLAEDSKVTGIIIQKPTRKVWSKAMEQVQRESGRAKYDTWWSSLLAHVPPEKDIDGLSPEVQHSFSSDAWKEKRYVLTATAKSVLISLSDALSNTHLLAEEGSFSEILEFVITQLDTNKIIIIGRSDLVGKPLYALFASKKLDVELLGKKELEARVGEGKKLLDADILISATGIPGLITGEMLSDGVIVVDVGEPHADVDRASVGEKPAFITPVPGGIGPVTVVSLLENAAELISY